MVYSKTPFPYLGEIPGFRTDHELGLSALSTMQTMSRSVSINAIWRGP